MYCKFIIYVSYKLILLIILLFHLTKSLGVYYIFIVYSFFKEFFCVFIIIILYLQFDALVCILLLQKKNMLAKI